MKTVICNKSGVCSVYNKTCYHREPHVSVELTYRTHTYCTNYYECCGYQDRKCIEIESIGKSANTGREKYRLK